MNGDRFFLDTFFVVGLLNPDDDFHEVARSWLPRVRAAREVWTTEAVLIEIADHLSRGNRVAVVRFIRALYKNANLDVAHVDSDLLERGLDLYESRRDKTWGLTDCISFVVLWEHGLTEALTADEHFIQAGFKAVLK